MGKLDGKKVAIIATDGFEEVELLSPKEALQKEGAEVTVLSPSEGSIRAWKAKEWGLNVDVDRDVGQAQAEEYDALMLPGGVINADHLRADEDAVRLVSEFFELNKPVAAICHAPWTLIEAGAVKGRRMTSYHTLKSDLMNAGAQWVDETAVVDGNLLTSRAPPDLPVFNEKMVDLFARGAPRAGLHAEPEVDEEAGLETTGAPYAGQPRSGLSPSENIEKSDEGEPVAGVEPLKKEPPLRRPKKQQPSGPPPLSRGTTQKYAQRRPPPKRGR
jgi:protease I